MPQVAVKLNDQVAFSDVTVRTVLGRSNQVLRAGVSFHSTLEVLVQNRDAHRSRKTIQKITGSNRRAVTWTLDQTLLETVV